MSLVTEDNSETFLAVVGWMLFAWGVYGTYYAVSQALLQLAFSNDVFTFNLESAGSIAYEALTLVFPILAIWLGAGLLKRNRATYRSIFLVGWLYILLWSAATILSVVQMFHATSFVLNTGPSPGEVAEPVKEARTIHLAYATRAGVRLLAETILILWVLHKFKSEAIRKAFAAE